MVYFLSRIRNRRLAISLGLLIIVGAVIIDLAFSGNPALSLGILLVVVIIAGVRLSMLGRSRPRGPGQRR